VRVALRRAVRKPCVIAVVLDGLAFPLKPFGALLELFARAPRYGSALVVLTHDGRNVLAALEQWGHKQLAAQKKGTILRDPGFAVAANAEIAGCVYGSTEHTEATILLEDSVSLPFGGRITLEHLINRVRTDRLREALSHPPVCHSGRLFLIESFYYTDKFFEVRALLTNRNTRTTLTLWLRSLLATLKPMAVIYNVGFLGAVLTEALQSMGPLSGAVQLLEGKGDNVFSLAIDAASLAGHTGQIVVLLDVLCTGTFIGKFFRMFPPVNRTKVISIVDVRDTDASYISVPTAAGSVDVPVLSAFRGRMAPKYERPSGISVSDVVVIDSLTHTPTRYPIPEKADLDETLLLRRADDAGGLAAGHYILKDKHYTYFLSF
jgi:hypothetical protein